MAKKQKCPEFENHERWLVAFADMMTLLFALFVVLYAMANLDKSKAKKVEISIQKAFANEFDDETMPEGVPRGHDMKKGIFRFNKGNTNRDQVATRTRREMAAIIAADTAKVEREIAERLYGSKDFPQAQNQKPEDRVVFINKDNDGIRITLLARKFFNPNEATLTNEARSALDGVALAVKNIGRQVRVEGHTDNRPFNINGMTNWELSGARASAVVRYFINQHKYNPRSLYAAGFADTQPVASNETPEDRSMNRRVDIKILYDTPTDYVPSDESAKGSEAPSEPAPSAQPTP
ncbi:MAG: OmpA/MotB family protein [Silvanigrellaceae bacterium]